MMREDPNSPALRKGVDLRGTTNATERVTEYVKPGRERAAFHRYIKINLPRTTKALLLLVIAVIGAVSATVALSDFSLFSFAEVLQWFIVGLSFGFVAPGLVTSMRIWGLGAIISVLALVVYAVGSAGEAPFVWNGASVPLAAMWNLTLMMPLAYLVLYWALRQGLIVAHPDNQNFMD